MASINYKKAEPKGDYSDHLRVIMLGKTGNGKSATVNTLIGERAFEAISSSDSVTKTCQAVSFELMDQKILLVDTPGLSDTHREDDVILNELKNVIELTYPGPHVFILLLTVGRFTKEEQKNFETISNFFGKDIFNHAMIIFTKIDDLEHDDKTLKDFIENSGIHSLTEIIKLCKGNYFGVSNRWGKNNPKTINFKENFFNTINSIVLTNNNDIYTSIQFETSIKHFIAEKNRLEEEIINSKNQNDKMENLIKQFQDQVIILTASKNDFEEEKRRLEQETNRHKQTQEELNRTIRDQQANLEELTKKIHEFKNKGGCFIL